MSCDNISVTLHYNWEGEWDTEPIAYRRRNIVDYVFVNGRNTKVVVGSVISWESGFENEIDDTATIFSTLAEWHEYCTEHSICNGPNFDYFTVDPGTRSRCFSATPPAQSAPFLSGASSPPPKRKKEMCCPCDVIATMIERSMAEKARQSEIIKDHIDQRFIEALKNINKQLGAIDIDLDLDPVIKEIRQVRTDLWNGLGGQS
ncbi:hypothetical protein QUB68_28260 [Microcoleus sp. A006_D1]|uniref:hypothetical protein n=1 Tax=Microcoleus sp. A006_D1 TaxID=3055267 RepID=UPI002FD6B2FE